MSEQAAHQETLARLWEEHMRHEFDTKSTDDTIATMVEDAYVNHIPVLTGGVGRADLRAFYSTHFIPKMPPDMAMTPISRTIGVDQLGGGMVIKFTHTIEMDWMLPGIAPTGRRVEVPLVVIVHFRDGKLAHEHIYWDKASVLAQLGLLDPATLPIAGDQDLLKLVRNHHEHYDGTGYPDRLIGAKIPFGARILTVSDSFEAMTSERPYRKAFTSQEALEQIKATTGTKFDPKVVEALLLATKTQEMLF